jgi:hypothetical protein
VERRGAGLGGGTEAEMSASQSGEARFARFAAAVSVTAVVLVSAVATQNVKERFTGHTINMNRGTTATIDFTIERWSSDAEREKLLSIIAEKKDPTQALLTTLQRMPSVGAIRTPQTLAWDLRCARQFKDDEGGRRIVLATDRPLGFGEVYDSARTLDYPFTIIEIRLNARDEGEGKILAGTKIFVDKNKEIVLENWGQQPTRFNNIRKQK